MLFSYIISVKAYIANGWDKRLVDPDPGKKYTRPLQNNASSEVSANSSTATATTQLQSHSSADSEPISWPTGPYTQQIQGILPPILTDHIILAHLQTSGKQLKPKKHKDVPTNIDYFTLQRGH